MIIAGSIVLGVFFALILVICGAALLDLYRSVLDKRRR